MAKVRRKEARHMQKRDRASGDPLLPAHGHHQVVNTEIILIIFFAAEDREALCSHQKQDLEPTVAQIIDYLIAKSRLILKTVGKTTRS